MKWPILLVLGAVVLLPGVFLGWAWQRGVLWGRSPSGLCVDIRRTQYQGHRDSYCFWLKPGRIGWQHTALDPTAPTDFTNGGGVSQACKFLVFEYEAVSVVTGSHVPVRRLLGGMRYTYWAPFWALLLIWAVPAVPCMLALKREWIRRHRKRHGLCLGCGYDLRESRDRCPECGQIRPSRGLHAENAP